MTPVVRPPEPTAAELARPGTSTCHACGHQRPQTYGEWVQSHDHYAPVPWPYCGCDTADHESYWCPGALWCGEYHWAPM